MPTSTAETLLLNKIFSLALEKKATDIHLIAGNYPIFRLQDKLYVMGEGRILTLDTISVLLDSFLSEDEKRRLAADKEVRTVYLWADRARFRASVFYQKGYPSISLRLIPGSVPDPEQLHLPQVILQKLASRQGLMLISGPFNSGRTTTVASLLNFVNERMSKRIVTLERPIEYILENRKSVVIQREVGKDTPSFVQGMRDTMEDDVEIVAATDLKEEGIHEMVLTSAESGRLVIAMMDANSASSALEKFLDSIPIDKRQWAKHSLAAVLLAIVNQRLLPSIGGGRILAAEIMTMSPAVSSILQEEAFGQLSNIMQTSRDEGMVTLDFRLSELVKQGKISADIARDYAIDPHNLRV